MGSPYSCYLEDERFVRVDKYGLFDLADVKVIQSKGNGKYQVVFGWVGDRPPIPVEITLFAEDDHNLEMLWKMVKKAK